MAAGPTSIDELVEELAAIEHERWAHWQQYMHSEAERQPDGSLLIPAALVERWERQIKTDYDQLPEDERESDREQVMKYLPLVQKFFTGEPS
ncbi:hypothetical protein [Rhizobium grahamii]|uniref:Uncharacterized protein n=1 Tax=Rhizobium grahamii TaxID=1120045 RepID=A0A370KHS2_9HYPH|nr:hypothetical protein [Rhizobium grahamii]RDJ05076.1 hypothetical protein B5K06_26260 [Rhizobium grahamii]